MRGERVTIVLAMSVLLSVQAAAQGPGPKAPEGPPSKTWERKLLDATRPKPAGVTFDIAVTESPIAVATLEEFQAAVRRAGPRMAERGVARTPGSAAWDFGWRWETMGHMNRCEFKDVTVRLTYELDVAQLPGPLAADSLARVWWTSYADERFAWGVEVLKLMRDEARKIQQQLKLMSDATCSELTNRAGVAGRDGMLELVDQLKARGAEMGALPDPIARRP